MGYSQPHVIVKSPETNPDIANLEVSGSWGSGIATENHVISVTSDLVNIASCSQNAPGYPAELSIKFHKDGLSQKGTRMELILNCRTRLLHPSSWRQQTFNFCQSRCSRRL